MALQICAVDGTRYPGVNDDGTAAVCPECGSDQYQSEGLELEEVTPARKRGRPPKAAAAAEADGGQE